MSEVLAIIESTMRADADAARVISQNIANAEVTAYRRQVPVSTEFADVLAGIPQQAEPTRSSTAIDWSAGVLKATGEPLDLAIEGKGFFVLQSEAGQLLTRRGEFRVSADGVLTAAGGEPVLGQSGPISVGTDAFSVAADGTVSVSGQAIDRLLLLEAEDASQLQYLGEGHYMSDAATALNEVLGSSVRQGFLEGSNVSSVGEMVQLMETLRHFEAAQRLARGYDELIGKAISELGKVT